MARVAPVNLPYNVKTLWFDPGDMDVKADDKVVVRTARGLELGVCAGDIMDVDEVQISQLKSPLKPIERIATPEDEQRAEEMDRLGREAMPTFRRLAHETSEDMHPVSVEYMLDGDKAIFYFESEERIDFRDLVKKLASEFHVRIDMRQIGVRDEARIVGGIAHCGQLVCCKRLGGEFKPVSIRMAKDQDLSLNPQKISGLCGRLMCCLRYENDVYKEFKSEAPKMDALIHTPDGDGRAVDYDVPRDTISVKVGDEKPIKVPVSAFVRISDNKKEATVSDEAWINAVEDAKLELFESSNIFSMPDFTGEDKLGDAKAVHHEPRKGKKGDRSQRSQRTDNGQRSESSRKGRGGQGSDEEPQPPKRTPRRRSTTINSDGAKVTKAQSGSSAPDKGANGEAAASDGAKGRQRSQRQPSRQQPSQKRSGQRGGAQKGNDEKKDGQKAAKVRPGHRSSGLAHDDGKKDHAVNDQADGAEKRQSPNRRRRHRGGRGRGGSGSGAGNSAGNGTSPNGSGSAPGGGEA